MKSIVHISDMHFGRSDPKINDALLSACLTIDPDIFVISGDFTQRATVAEFEQARAFIKQLDRPKKRIVAIPGNHDIEPLYKPLARLRTPYNRYQEFIAPHTVAEYSDAQLAIGSINTVRASRLKGGHVSKRSLAEAENWFTKQKENAVRLLITHHPLDLPSASPKRKLARRSTRGVYRLARSRVDMYLSGHYHRSSAVVTRTRYPKDHYAAIALQAGTVSLRSRGQLQSFNVLNITRSRIDVSVYMWNPKRNQFIASETMQFVFENDRGWV